MYGLIFQHEVHALDKNRRWVVPVVAGPKRQSTTANTERRQTRAQAHFAKDFRTPWPRLIYIRSGTEHVTASRHAVGGATDLSWPSRRAYNLQLLLHSEWGGAQFIRLVTARVERLISGIRVETRLTGANSRRIVIPVVSHFVAWKTGSSVPFHVNAERSERSLTENTAVPTLPT